MTDTIKNRKMIATLVNIWNQSVRKYLCVISLRALRTAVAVSVAAWLFAMPSSAQEKLKVPLTVQEAVYPGVEPSARVQEPVTVGVPLGEASGIRDAAAFGLEGARLGQFRVLGWWPNGNVKWVLLDTEVDVDAKGLNQEVSLTAGKGNFGGAPLAKDYPTKIVVNTGSAEFTIRKSRFNVLDRVTVGDHEIVKPGTSHGLVILGPVPGGRTVCGACETVYASSNDTASKAEIEENGPVRAVVKASGEQKDSHGNAYMGFTVRMTFYAGKTYVKVTSSLRNADADTSRFASAFKGFHAYELQLSAALEGTKSFAFGTSGAPAEGALKGTEDAYLYQAYSSYMEHDHWAQTKPRKEGGSHREVLRSFIDRQLTENGEWKYEQEGYQVKAAGETLAQGPAKEAVAGWADVRDASGVGVLIGLQELSANWPKLLEFRGGGTDVRIGLWPKYKTKPYYQAWPQYSTQDSWLDFHKDGLKEPSEEFNKLEHFLIARAPRDYYNDTGVFPFTLMDPNEEDAYYRSIGVECCVADIQPFAFRFYYWAQPGEGNQNDWRWNYLMQWLARGLPGRYLTAGNFYRFVVDQGFPRSDGFEWRNQTHAALDYWGFPEGHPANKTEAHRCWVDQNHAHWYGMTDYYFITGDGTIRDALLDGVKDRFLNARAKLNDGSLGNARAVGAALMGFARFHDFLSTTRDQDAEQLRAIGDSVVKKEVLPELKLGGMGDAEVGISRTRGVYGNAASTVEYQKTADVRTAQTFLNSILIEGMWEYAQEHGPLWATYDEMMDLAYGLGEWALHEMFVDSGELSSSGFRYLIFVDFPNHAEDNEDFHVSALGNVMFPFFIAHEWTGDTSWRKQFEIALQRSSQQIGKEWPRVSNIGVSAVTHAVLHPESRPRLVNIALQEKWNGQGQVELSWKPPANALEYRLKFVDGRQIVDWLDFDPVRNAFRLDPNQYCPWFAAEEVRDMPEPGSGADHGKLLLTMDPKKKWSFVLRAYVPQEPKASAPK